MAALLYVMLEDVTDIPGWSEVCAKLCGEKINNFPAETSVNMRRGLMGRCLKMFVNSNGHTDSRVHLLHKAT
jgi:hypothetical protein